MESLLKGSKVSCLLRLSDSTGASINLDTCSQILLKLYHIEISTATSEFKLVSEAQGDKLLTIVEIDSVKYLRFYLDTTDMETGYYDSEVKITYLGVQPIIIKQEKEFIQIKDSRT